MSVFRRTGNMVSKEKEAKHNEVTVDFLKINEKVTAVDIAERLHSTIHMSVGEVQLYLGELIDKNQITIDQQGYHSWKI
jgi:hypothetical protein